MTKDNDHDGAGQIDHVVGGLMGMFASLDEAFQERLNRALEPDAPKYFSTLTQEAITADPVNAVDLPLPRNPTPALLDAAEAGIKMVIGRLDAEAETPCPPGVDPEELSDQIYALRYRAERQTRAIDGNRQLQRGETPDRETTAVMAERAKWHDEAVERRPWLEIGAKLYVEAAQLTGEKATKLEDQAYRFLGHADSPEELGGILRDALNRAAEGNPDLTIQSPDGGRISDANMNLSEYGVQPHDRRLFNQVTADEIDAAYMAKVEAAVKAEPAPKPRSPSRGPSMG